MLSAKFVEVTRSEQKHPPIPMLSKPATVWLKWKLFIYFFDIRGTNRDPQGASSGGADTNLGLGSALIWNQFTTV